jgi:hypothetical protein
LFYWRFPLLPSIRQTANAPTFTPFRVRFTSRFPTRKTRITAARIPHNSTRSAAFRATGITAYLENGGTIENAQAIAAHESPRTTKLYDRTNDEITLDEVERILI